MSGIEQRIFSNQKFINSLFHELRIPISSINGYASLFLSGELGRLPKSQLKTIKKIRDLSLYASELINNLLSLSRLGTQRVVHYEKVSISDLIHRTITTLNVQIHSRGLKLHTKFNKKTGIIWAFPLDIEQIINNILSNGVKFTPKRGNIYITGNKKKDRFYLNVRDTGIGIPPEALSRIFEDFYRADNAIHQYEGSGLGLPIVKRLLEYNKGEISIKSKLNSGTNVLIALPILTDKEVFDYELMQAVSESSRLSISFGVLMILDKTLEKTPPKNQLIDAMNAAIRKNDRSYQIDARKCVAILPDSDYAEVHIVSERLKSILHEKVLVIALTFAVFPADGATKEELLSYLEREINKPTSVISIA